MENSMCKVSIIIPHYNQKEYLKRLLPSITDQTFGDYEVIIIDDATPDRSVVEYIETFIKDHRNMRLVENTENMRFIKTCNKGIGLAKGEYICLLNADTEVKSNFVERNVEILDADGSIGVLSCIMVDQDGDNWFTGGSFKGGLPVNLTDDFQGIRPVDWIAGTAPFYRKDVFDRIGLFDENYRMYHEDVEFGLRLQAETDYKACMFPEKLVAHYLEPSIPRMEVNYLLCRNHILILKKYYPRYLPKVLLWYTLDITRTLVRALLEPSPKFLFVKPRPRKLSVFVKMKLRCFLWALNMAGGILAGLVNRQSK
ncbi:MAG TPA: glycosyltransferase family 2 protein [Dehalococcoidia bacterium]|nr:glycosyltransferase family 2 protein [Dehalococcoidia bacterium]